MQTPKIAPAILVALLSLTGCQPAVKWDLVQSQSEIEFQQWRSVAARKMKPEERTELDAMLDELRWADSDRTKKDVYRLIDQKPLAEVLRIGYEARIRRQTSLWAELKAAIEGNALLVPKAGDRSAAQTLERYQREQHARLEKIGAEIDAAEKRLAALQGRPHVSRQWGIEAATLSRADALREIDDFIDRRRAAALAKHGAWPVIVDEWGSRLPEGERQEFATRKVKAQSEGRVLIAVGLREKWWIYDAPKEEPGFPPAVMANLREGDRSELAVKWAALQAEQWARTEAWQEKHGKVAD